MSGVDRFDTSVPIVFAEPCDATGISALVEAHWPVSYSFSGSMEVGNYKRSPSKGHRNPPLERHTNGT